MGSGWVRGGFGYGFVLVYYTSLGKKVIKWKAMRFTESNEHWSEHHQENMAKIRLVDTMVGQAFKYRGNTHMVVLYSNFIRNRETIWGEGLYDALNLYFDTGLTMQFSHLICTLIQSARFTHDTLVALEEFYELFETGTGGGTGGAGTA